MSFLGKNQRLPFKYNLKPDDKDERDYKLSQLVSISSKNKRIDVDLRDKMPPVYNQFSQGSCTANAGCANKEYMEGNKANLSRQFLYNQERISDGTFPEDAGSQMRTICQTLQKYGICREELLPYGDKNIATIPSKEAYEDALLHRIQSYYRVEDPFEMMYALEKGHPILLGITVYESFEETDEDGFIKMPDIESEAILGGHATLLVGAHYIPESKTGSFINKLFHRSDKKNYFILRNSWGSDGAWGDKGYGYLPIDVLETIIQDAWVILK